MKRLTQKALRQDAATRGHGDAAKKSRCFYRRVAASACLRVAVYFCLVFSLPFSF
jgi:hypothetical protein